MDQSLQTHGQLRLTMTHCIPITLCFIFLNLYIADISAQLIIHPKNVLRHPQLGFALLLPLSRQTANHSLPRHKTAHRLRELSGSIEANARMTLYDDLLTKGYYTSRLWIGTPPQEFALIVDTGSTVTYVPCSSCTQCGTHQDPNFKPEASSTYKPKKCGPQCSSCDTEKQQCKYERRYAEMSTSKGLLGDDVISFGTDGTLGPERLVFGCETAESGDIYDQKADGIMGLGRGHLSIVDQLVEHNVMTAAFSLCYGGMDEGGGAMIMGAVPSPPAMVFTHSDFRRSAYYNLGLQEVHVGGSPLNVDPGIFDSNFGTVLDSGTTYAYFPEKAFEAFKAAVTQQVKLKQVAGPDSRYPDVCFGGAGSDLSELSHHFPEVQLKFGDGQIISLAPENYLFKHLKVQGAYCLGIFNNGKDSATLLGGIVVRNMLVTYDRVNQQIGFWKTNCSDLWSNLQAVIPAAFPPSGSAVAYPPAVEPHAPTAGVIPGPTCVSGNVDVTMFLSVNYTAFQSMKSTFLDDLSQGLEIDISQVSLIKISSTGENVSAVFTVHLAATDEHLLDIMAQNIVARLTKHEVHLHDTFGAYGVTGWTMTSTDNRSLNSTRISLLILALTASLIMLSAGIGFLVWWYLWRFRGQKYLNINEQNIEMSDQP